MRNSRRKFIRNSSLAATSIALLSATKKNNLLQESAIGCAPEIASTLSGNIVSSKSGKWSDVKTWEGGRVPGAGDSPLIATGHTVMMDVDSTVAGLSISDGGVLQFNAALSATLQSSGNVTVEGVLRMRPSNVSVVHTVRFININESNYVGSTMDPVASDVGLWVMGAGALDLCGTSKTGWTNAADSVPAGATSFAVKDSTGWKVGDEIVIAPMDQPDFYSTDWIDSSATLIDFFLPKFERRIITAISGNTVTFAGALVYDHSAVTSNVTSPLGNSSRKWTAEVANLTRNVRVEGTKNGTTDAYANFKRAHIFIRSTAAQSVKYMQGKYLGPRKLQDGGNRPTLITGRYALHFHHCEDGSRGSIVEGCVLTDIGSRCYVPHVSHGITLKNNVAFNSIGEAFWYDWQEISHNCVWDGNLMAAIRINGADRSCTGMLLGQGDGNIARNNAAVYANCGVAHNGGACYVWQADAEGVWIFENNISHSSITGISVWQNTGNNHTIINYDSFSCYEGISHGAYGNSYTYRYGHHYKSKIFNEATSGNTSGVVFQDLFVDAAGADYCAEIVDSPIPSDIKCTNKFINCVFRNYKISAVQLASLMLDSNVEKQSKKVDLICCDIVSGKAFVFDHKSLYPLKNNSQIRVQPVAGQCFQTLRSNNQDVNSNIGVFAPTVYGTGMGLSGNYYNGTTFNDFAFSRIDSMIMFQQWSYDKASSPTGVHYLITGDQYSMRWTGQVEAQYSEPYIFYTQGGGGFRLWLNGDLIIDSWYDRADAAEIVTSKTVTLTAKTKYSIKLEHFNAAGSRGCMLHWKSPSLPVMSLIPQCQLYADPLNDDGSTTSLMTVSAGSDVAIALPINKVNLRATVSNEEDDAKLAYLWTKVSGPAQYSFSNPNSFTTNVKGLVAGTYTFRVQVKDSKGNTAQDDVMITVQAANNTASMTADSLAVTAYPNPSPSNFHMQVISKSSSPITLTIFNNYGKQVAVHKALANHASVTVGDNFERGAYYGIAEQDGIRQTINLMKL